jgi:hypothetical protein
MKLKYVLIAIAVPVVIAGMLTLLYWRSLLEWPGWDSNTRKLGRRRKFALLQFDKNVINYM